ncbi:SGNH/GDSL hydrolase family protein [Pseudobacter ginsenosidimutans]|uniref:GDSL-like lipase/acylhydrolase family protein n=2 Tax=Pseudobacter ginsenosidimutans TaxID=661488 RepID=A0A4Q7MR01_9BACT|nr:SGNH/GDSL hydrolase family protein [Pseudobacter ginsenosidimutans]QEC42012.1 acetyl xylan esterase [Pseudobacter ginsenosidimutans]RZS71155.1 GDSL-like lipase/acylhydrolase family protein [Pseudobacter ginsenosidimutans]
MTKIMAAFFLLFISCSADAQLKWHSAADPNLHYIGRIDFSNPQLPRFWAPGVYCTGKFKGDSALLLVKDEMLWGSNHNYITIVMDDEPPVRLQLKSGSDTILLKTKKKKSTHRFLFCKATESNIGYCEIAGIACEALLAPDPLPIRKIEFIGNSITCSAGSDASVIPCGKGKWEDQHNAYLGYASITARTLQSQWQLTAVSGIGLMHSCCGMKITMPQVFDKISLHKDTIQWDLNRYQPDVVTICLGQNDGVQDSTEFCSRYIEFLQTLRRHYPAAELICLTSPMADMKLNKVQRNYLQSITASMQVQGDRKVSHYFFSKIYNSGCDWHPDLKEHALIAAELTKYIRKRMKW